MKFKNKICVICFLILALLFPIFKVDAVGIYEVHIIGRDIENFIASYENYNDAKTHMINYKSDTGNVAVIKVYGRIVNAKYAIARFTFDKNNPLGENPKNEHRLFKYATDTNSYASVHAAYGNDAAFIDYDPISDRAKIKISGFTGYVNMGIDPTITVVPISKIQSNGLWIPSKDDTWMKKVNNNVVMALSSTPLTIRSDPYTTAPSQGSTCYGCTYQYYDTFYDGTYTWYKVSGYSTKTYYTKNAEGELLHYFATHNSQGVTNLGKAAYFMGQGESLFSFDGNYYYKNLTDMFDDYRNNVTTNAENPHNPHFPYYLYLPNKSKTNYTANDFDQIIVNKGYYSKSDSMMFGEGFNFILSQEKYGTNALLTFSAALNESAAGRSAIARDKNNLFGHGAYGSDPYTRATTYGSVAEGIMAHASLTGQGYNNPNDSKYFGAHYGNKQSGMNIKYATDPYWGEKAASFAYTNDKAFGLQDFDGATVAIKTWEYDVPVKKEPNSASDTIYKLRNKDSYVYNIPVTVLDMVYNEGKYWFKIRTDVALDSNKNISYGDYNFDTSYAYAEASYFYNKNNQPVLVASDRTINKGENIDLLSGVIATDYEDGNITSSIKIDGVVYINIPGKYDITYTATDKQNFSVTKTVTITVNGITTPEIVADNKEIVRLKSFDPKALVTANDAIDGDITDKIAIIENTVNKDALGTYKIKYSVTNSTNQTSTKEISVTVIENEKPTINAANKKIAQNKPFNALDSVTANDKEDGNVSNRIVVTQNNVDITTLGIYKVKYTVTDLDNQITTKEIDVEVEENTRTEKTGEFYLDHLKIVSGTLEIKGYNTISGIDNNLGTDIKYKIVFENTNDSTKEYEQEIKRLKNINEIPYDGYGTDGKNYTYSWFKDEVNFDSIPNGNYYSYLVAYTDDYYSKNLIKNVLLTEQTSNYENNGKYITILNEYFNKNIPVYFRVRSSKIGVKETSSFTNQYSMFEELDFTNDNKLHIMAAAYSVGIDMGVNANVTRKIIFENTKTFEKFEFDGSYIDNGPFEMKLLTTDGFGKTRAWFNKDLDISSIPKGNYAIYIASSSNKSDYGEFTEILLRPITTKQITISGKKYSLKVNNKERFRIELNVD
jgi:Beta- N-acetylglucosaminidase